MFQERPSNSAPNFAAILKAGLSPPTSTPQAPLPGQLLPLDGDARNVQDGNGAVVSTTPAQAPFDPRRSSVKNRDLARSSTPPRPPDDDDENDEGGNHDVSLGQTQARNKGDSPPGRGYDNHGFIEPVVDRKKPMGRTSGTGKGYFSSYAIDYGRYD